MQQLEVGQILEGTVTGVKNFGAFVKLPTGDVGLVHISHVSKDYVENIEDYIHENDNVKVKVLSCEEVEGKKKISLSIRLADENANNFNRGNKRKEWNGSGNKEGFNKNDNDKSNSFEDMMAKFKKESDEKLSDLNQRLDSF